MSFFDDASLIYIADFAAASASAVSGSGTNTGKAYSIKPTDGSGDFTFERGSDITATRVNKDGYIEKGRGNFLLNSVWDGVSTDTRPTGWTAQSVTGTGTFDVTSTEGQIRFTTEDASSRSFIYSPSILINGILTVSVYVDQVYTTCPINQVIVRSGNATAISYFEDGVEISSTTNVQAGKRYNVVFNKTGTTTFRFGVGASSNTLGDIVLSRPQLEQGLVATDYIETTTAPLRAGLLEDEPRFDYHNSASASPNTCPSLLLEPSRTNLITNSEYFEGTNWGVGGSTEVELITSITSPDGTNSVYLVTSEEGNNSSRVQYNLGALGNDYIFSVFIKGTGTATRIRLRNNTASVDAVEYDIDSSGNFTLHSENAHDGYYGAEPYGNGWYRVYLKVETNSISNNFMQIFSDIIDADGSIYVWGAQAEEGSYITSYIPTYGTAATRGGDSSTGGTISNINEGVLFFEGSVLKNNGTIKLIEFNDGGLNNVIQLYYRDSSGTSPRVYAIAKSGGNQIYGHAYDIPSGRGEITHKVAFRFEDNNFALFYNGTKVHSQTSGTISTNPKNQVMYETSLGAFPFRGNVKQTIVFPEALSDDDCRTLTTL